MMWACALCEATEAGTLVTRRKNSQLCDWCLAELKRTARLWCTRGRHVVTELARGRLWCKPCERARTANYTRPARTDYAKAWRATNAAHVTTYRAAYYAAHRDELCAKQRAVYWSDPDKARAIYRVRHARHAARRAAWRRAYYWQRADIERAGARRRYVARKLRILRGQL